jgi:hypothetical protein
MPFPEPVHDAPSACSPAGEWSLYWAKRDAEIPAGRDPLLGEWADIDERERALGIGSGTPILIDPQHGIDPRLAPLGARRRIEAFITSVNHLADQNGLAADRIPDDPDGAIVLSRFRRTIAWHIARLPGGRIALATQYGHLRASAVTDGYSGRARQGLRRVLEIETARSMAGYLDDLAGRINDGEGISGPAAQRMIKAAKDASVRFEGMFLTPKQADALLDEPQFNVYDSPASFLTCNNDPAKAMCHPERPGRSKRNLPPAIDRCDPACANIARTDTHIARLQAEVAQLGEEITSPLTPTPLRERLKQRVTALQAIVNRHDRTRVALAWRDPGPEAAGD